MAIALRYAARSDVGLGRYRNNQDSGYAGPHLLAVADGMGGHAGGDVASSIAVAELSTLDGESLGPDAVRYVEESLASARETIRTRAREDPGLAGMGTTVTAVLRFGRRLVLAHIGDSRAYLLHDGRLSRVTKDHTFVQSLVDEGRISPEEAEHHPQRSVIMRVLGDVDTSTEVDTSVREAAVGDRWLLCSDGLSGVVPDATLEAVLSSVPDPEEAAERLLRLALDAGAPDNVTCVVADVVDVGQGEEAGEAAELGSCPPQVVGAAANGRTAPYTGPGDRGPRGPQQDPPRRGRRRPLVRLLAAGGVLALLLAGGFAAWAWSQQQYYVAGAAGSVAIYRGLGEDLGPLRLSSVQEEQDLPLEALPPVWQERVEAGIAAEDLDDARRIVRDLLHRSELCEPEPARPLPTPSPSALPPPGAVEPEATVTALPPPGEAGSAPQPSPTPSPSLPEGCEEVG